MALITDSISYNVRERGRKFRGVDRNLDTVALAALINGPDIQEKVRHGDMLGYLGHWARIKFGLEVKEGGIDPSSGKAIELPVAIRTVELAAEDDGTITHKAEFLSTPAGEYAAGVYKSKAGGFSSAIDTVPRTTPAIPRGFHGFDFVYEPNYTTNRGHAVALDGVSPELAAMLDSAVLLAGEEQAEMIALFDSLHGQHLTALEALDHMMRERDWAISRLAQVKRMSIEEVLDSVALEHVAVQRIADPDYARFRDMPLEALNELPKPKAEAAPEVERAARQYGVSMS